MNNHQVIMRVTASWCSLSSRQNYTTQPTKGRCEGLCFHRCHTLFMSRRALFIMSSSGIIACGSLFSRQASQCESQSPQTNPRSEVHIFGLASGGKPWGGTVWQITGQGCPTSLALGGGILAASMPNGSLLASCPEARQVLALSSEQNGGEEARSVAVDGRGNIFYITKTGNVRGLKRRMDGWVPSPDTQGLERIKKICCGASHCIALDEQGRAHSWATQEGGGEKGCLGRRWCGEAATTPGLVEMPDGAGEIVHAACGDAHSLMLGRDGRVWAFGSDRWLQLGLSETWENGASHRNLPVEVKELTGRGVSMIACGADHSLAYTAVGEVYAWGRGKEGQLGANKKVFASAGIAKVSGTPSLPALRPQAIAAAGHCSLIAVQELDGSSSLWWLGRCPVPKTAEVYAKELAIGCGTSVEGDVVLGMGSLTEQRGNPKGGDALKTAGAVALLPAGTHLGEGCASCRAKNKVKEIMAAQRKAR